MHLQPLRLLIPRTDRVPSVKDLTVRAKDDIRQFIAEGLYKESDVPALFLCRIATAERSYSGVFALNDIADFHEGRIKKHEKTLARREAEYLHLLQEWQSVIKPVLLTYPPQQEMGDWIEAYMSRNAPDVAVEVPEDGELHQFWAIKTPEQYRQLQQLFAALVPEVYIADGHHRTTTIAHLAQTYPDGLNGMFFDQLFCAFFAADQLTIKGYHRVVSLPEGRTLDDMKALMKERLKMKPLEQPRLPLHRREVVAVFPDECLSFVLEMPVETHTLDASLLSEQVFAAIWELADPRQDKAIRFVDGARGLNGVLEEVNHGGVGFLLHPVAFDDLFYLSDQGESLPPKSTWFEPRIKSGLTVYSFHR